MSNQTPEEVIKKLNKLSSILAKEIEGIKIIAANNIEADFKRRIFVQGQAVKGKIGVYSTSPYYVSIAGQKSSTGSQISNKKLTPKGKNGKSKFKNGNAKKSRYLKEGYKEFRRLVGRQTKYVDLNLSSGLFSTVKAGKTKKGVQLGFTDNDMAKRAEHLEEKYGKDIFVVRKEEEEKIENLITDRLNNTILKNL